MLSAQVTTSHSASPVMNDSSPSAILELSGVSKKFQGTVALQGVNFDLLAGEVHVLFGENGAGKSTLINLIAGTFEPSEGGIVYAGEPVAHLTSAKARRMGIAAVFQEFSLVPQLSVENNLFLGREELRFGFLDRKAIRSKSVAILNQLRFAISPTATAGRLSRAQQQMVEIAKALLFEPRILILDEPTASLTEAETAILFEAIARLKKGGVGIIYVSHRMQEIRALADRVTVLRDGRKVATVRAADVTDDELVSLMVGREIDQLFPSIAARPGPVRLDVRGISAAHGAVRDVSLTLHGGEIVGVGGLIGSGKSEFVRAVFGLEPLEAGEIVVDGVAIRHPTPARMLARKVCYFPADRTIEGLALGRSIAENASVTALSTAAVSRGPFLRHVSERRLVGGIVERLAIKPRQTSARVGNLSGGNRQKVMLARGLARPTEIFLFEEPTVGIDVGAKLDVYRTIERLVEAGHAILIVSSDLPELLHLSHRLVVFSGGRVVAELKGDTLSERDALSLFFRRPADLLTAAE